MLYRSLFPRDLFAELERLQREAPRMFEPSSNIRGAWRGSFPALNVGGTAQSVEIYAFAPGLDPSKLEVHIEQGVLSIAGERPNDLAGGDEKLAVHIRERFSGRFRRVVNLPDDVDPDAVDATYRDGVLRISVQRRRAAQPRRINIQ